MSAVKLRHAAVAALVIGCGGTRTELGEQGDASAPLAAPRTSALSTARDLARPDRAVADVLGGRIALLGEDHGFGETPKTPGDLALHVAAHANEPTRVGTDDEHGLSLSIEGAAPSDAVLDDGAVVHRDVFPATDALWATTESRAELLFLLRDASAPSLFRLHLDHGSGLERAIADQGGLSFRDARGNERLRIPMPIALDANGVRRAAAMTLSDDGHTLSIVVDTQGLAFPILLDPAVLQGRWVDQGSKRAATAGTLAWDPVRARLLVFGGYSATGSPTEPGAPNTSISTYTFPGRTLDPLNSGGPPTFTTAMLGSLSGSSAQTYGYFGAFDTTRNKLVAVGSSAYQCASSCTTNYKMWVYEWDSATNAWAQRCTTPTCAASTPPAQQKGVEIVYDEARKVSVVCLRSNRACWTWNGATADGTWTSIAAIPTPGLSRGFYDTKYGAATFIGSDGTYSWTGSWVKRTTSGLFASGATYDTIRKKAIAIVKGAANSVTYEWDGTAAAWTSLVAESTASPYNKADVAMGFDPVNGRAVAWGGGDGQTSYYAFDFVGNFWEYQAFGNACAGEVDCLGGSCRDGFCCDAKCGPCQRCDTTAKCAPFLGSATGVEHDTCTSTAACDTAGACKRKNGQTCGSGLECLSGSCVDGVCCSSACNQACEVCNATPGTCTPAPKGSSGRTSCGVGACNGTLRTCSSTCTLDTDCAASGYCNTPTCTATLGNGAACARDRQCTSGSCRDGFCCNSGCNGACETCSASKGATANGACTALPATTKPAACGGYACTGTSGACAASCTADTQCATGYYCDGSFCQKARAQGEGCARTEQCTSGLSCADGVCCNSACDGACQACSATNKQSGDASGVCGSAKAGSDPGDRCPKEEASTCGKSGVCGATGTCALYVKGSSCGTVACESGSAKGRTCDGLGTCATDTTGTSCAPGSCSTATGCTFACTTDADCDTTGFCDGGTCKTRTANGRTCTANNQCASGACADGLCCSTACTGVCEACNGVGTEGTCTAVAGAPRAGHGSCPGASTTDACTAAACDGATRDSCKALAGPDVVCRPASCADATESLAAKCDGSGKCPDSSARACAPFGCSGTRCSESCTTDDECAKGNRCNPTTNQCVSNGTCDGAHSVVGADGSKTDCSPYQCDATGCKAACATSSDCSAPAICDGSKCVLPAAQPDDSGGCAASPRSAQGSGWLMLLVAGLAARRRAARKGAL